MRIDPHAYRPHGVRKGLDLVAVEESGSRPSEDLPGPAAQGAKGRPVAGRIAMLHRKARQSHRIAPPGFEFYAVPDAGLLMGDREESRGAAEEKLRDPGKRRRNLGRDHPDRRRRHGLERAERTGGSAGPGIALVEIENGEVLPQPVAGKGPGQPAEDDRIGMAGEIAADGAAPRVMLGQAGGEQQLGGGQRAGRHQDLATFHGEGLPRVQIHALHRANPPVPRHQTGRGGSGPEGEAAGEQRLEQPGRHIVLGGDRTGPPVARAAPDARGLSVALPEVDRHREGKGMEPQLPGRRGEMGRQRRQPVGGRGIRGTSPRPGGILLRPTGDSEQPLRLPVEGLEVTVADRPFRPRLTHQLGVGMEIGFAKPERDPAIEHRRAPDAEQRAEGSGPAPAIHGLITRIVGRNRGKG